MGAGALGAGSLGNPWSGQQPAVRPGGPDDRWSGQQPAVPPPGSPGDRWSGQQPAARGGGPGDPWSGQQPAVPPPGSPGDRWSGQQPAARGGGPGDPWSGRQPAVDDPWGEAPGPGSGRWPATDPRGPGSPQEWEEAEAELSARLQEQRADPWEQVQPDRMWRRRSGSTPAVPSPPGGPAGPMDSMDSMGPGPAPSPHAPPPPAPPVPVPSRAQLPPVDPETKLWSARYLCDRLATEQREAAHAGRPFSLVLVQVPDGPLAALSYRRQVTLLRELGHQFVAGGLVDHLVHVPDQVQHWFAVILPDTDRASAQAFERRLRNGIGGYLRSRGLLLGDLESACLTSPDDDPALGVIWDTLIARGDPDAGRDRITRV
jgi:hypothetical protein